MSLSLQVKITTFYFIEVKQRRYLSFREGQFVLQILLNLAFKCLSEQEIVPKQRKNIENVELFYLPFPLGLASTRSGR